MSVSQINKNSPVKEENNSPVEEEHNSLIKEEHESPVKEEYNSSVKEKVEENVYSPFRDMSSLEKVEVGAISNIKSVRSVSAFINVFIEKIQINMEVDTGASSNRKGKSATPLKKKRNIKKVKKSDKESDCTITNDQLIQKEDFVLVQFPTKSYVAYAGRIQKVVDTDE
ncbi:unnamed protein product [Psylliodes chrysocephalus]|uniref:Uncharacterized protein n=1 Tax=Psylliodes chrysocephalus TaxID=3402493 RepID=A0A9P0CVE6_9CUCU|nr:unnamed protein product [Psylliodes chrysocephala]